MFGCDAPAVLGGARSWIVALWIAAHSPGSLTRRAPVDVTVPRYHGLGMFSYPPTSLASAIVMRAAVAISGRPSCARCAGTHRHPSAYRRARRGRRPHRRGVIACSSTWGTRLDLMSSLPSASAVPAAYWGAKGNRGPAHRAVHPPAAPLRQRRFDVAGVDAPCLGIRTLNNRRHAAPDPAPAAAGCETLAGLADVVEMIVRSAASAWLDERARAASAARRRSPAPPTISRLSPQRTAMGLLGEQAHGHPMSRLRTGTVVTHAGRWTI